MPLKLTRTTSENQNTILIYPDDNDDNYIEIKLVHMKGREVVLSIDALDHVEILRGELLKTALHE